MNNRLLKSSLGRKFVMAVTGLFLFAFVVVHLLGNLQIFLGPDTVNAYGNFLRNAAELVWVSRISLIALVVLHIWAAVSLTVENRAARPIPYTRYNPVVATYASRTMMMSGLIVAAFIVYHLLHFTVRVESINFTGQNFEVLEDAKQRHDIYRMMIVGFSNLWVSLFYVIGVGLLCLHLSHGASSFLQSIGIKNRRFTPAIDRTARVAALVIFLGYISIPFAVLTGILK